MKKLLIGLTLLASMSSFAEDFKTQEENIRHLTLQNKELRVVIPNSLEPGIDQIVRLTNDLGSFDYVMKFKDMNCEVVFPGEVKYEGTIYNRQTLAMAYKFIITGVSNFSSCSQEVVDMLERDAANGGLSYISRSSNLSNIIKGNTFHFVNPIIPNLD